MLCGPKNTVIDYINWNISICLIIAGKPML